MPRHDDVAAERALLVVDGGEVATLLGVEHTRQDRPPVATEMLDNLRPVQPGNPFGYGVCCSHELHTSWNTFRQRAVASSARRGTNALPVDDGAAQPAMWLVRVIGNNPRS